MPRKYPKEIRERAFRLYLEFGNVNDIAVLLNIQRKTIAKWCRNEDWDCFLHELREKRYKQIVQKVLERNVQYLSAFIDELHDDWREIFNREDAAHLIDWQKRGGIDLIGEVIEVRQFYKDLKRYANMLVYGEVKFTSTPCHFGGVRWWFICPKCERRCYKLYRPSWQRYFACRLCHELKYRR